MKPTELYSRIFGIEAPWQIASVELSEDSSEVHVRVELEGTTRLGCPECGKPAGRHDHRERSWRHLDTCQLPTYLHAQVPRVKCPEHGVHQVRVPWATERSGFTALFESLVIDWLGLLGTSGVVRMLRISWDQADGIEQRAVARGLYRRQQTVPEQLSVDETSFAKRHEYVTVVSDPSSNTVLHVSDDRSAESLREFYRSCSEEQLHAVRTVSMDMHEPYIKATTEFLSAEVICFDPFHVVQHLNNAVDNVRRQEHRALRRQGDLSLNRTRYLWLQNPNNMTQARYDELLELSRIVQKTARAWQRKEEASLILSRYKSRHWAMAAWKLWYGKAIRSRLEPIKKVARMIKRRLEGIVNAMVHRVSNAGAESINGRIQELKRQVRGFRNRERFRNAIYFRLGALDLYPSPVPNHTCS